MFITAVCVLFLIKLRWPKNKSIYDTTIVVFFFYGFSFFIVGVLDLHMMKRKRRKNIFFLGEDKKSTPIHDYSTLWSGVLSDFSSRQEKGTPDPAAKKKKEGTPDRGSKARQLLGVRDYAYFNTRTDGVVIIRSKGTGWGAREWVDWVQKGWSFATSFPGCLILLPLDEMRDPGNEVGPFVQRQYQKMHESEVNFQCHVGHFDWGYFLSLPNLIDSCGNHGEFFCFICSTFIIFETFSFHLSCFWLIFVVSWPVTYV